MTPPVVVGAPTPGIAAGTLGPAPVPAAVSTQEFLPLLLQLVQPGAGVSLFGLTEGFHPSPEPPEAAPAQSEPSTASVLPVPIDPTLQVFLAASLRAFIAPSPAAPQPDLSGIAPAPLTLSPPHLNPLPPGGEGGVRGGGEEVRGTELEVRGLESEVRGTELEVRGLESEEGTEVREGEVISSLFPSGREGMVSESRTIGLPGVPSVTGPAVVDEVIPVQANTATRAPAVERVPRASVPAPSDEVVPVQANTAALAPAVERVPRASLAAPSTMTAVASAEDDPALRPVEGPPRDGVQPSGNHLLAPNPAGVRGGGEFLGGWNSGSGGRDADGPLPEAAPLPDLVADPAMRVMTATPPEISSPPAVGEGPDRGAAASAPRSVVEQVVERVSLIHREGHHQLSLHLEPPELGAVRIEAVLEGRQLTIQIRAEQEPAREILEHALPRLRESLSQQGIAADRVTVHLGLDASPRESPGGAFAAWERPLPPGPPARALQHATRVFGSHQLSREGIDLWV